MANTPSSAGKVKGTVRNRKKSSLTSTQRYLPIAEIRNDTVMLKNGGLRAVLQVEAVNFNLKSETEQLGIIAGYQAFVNSVNFPIQIVVRSSKIDIDPYLSQIRALAERQPNPLLKEQTVAYADFVEKLVDVADIMQKRFYIVVPLDGAPRKRTLIEQFFGWMNPDDTLFKATSRQRDFLRQAPLLKDRVNLVVAGLENIGLSAKRLNTQELMEMYYQIYNPKTSQEQKLPPLDQLKMAPGVL